MFAACAPPSEIHSGGLVGGCTDGFVFSPSCVGSQLISVRPCVSYRVQLTVFDRLLVATQSQRAVVVPTEGPHLTRAGKIIFGGLEGA